MAYVRYINPRTRGLSEELLFSQYLETDCKGQSIFNAVKNYFELKSIALKNIFSCATDGAPSMVGRYRGFIALLKEAVPGVLAIHCILHRHNLVAKCFNNSLHESLNLAVKAVNKIKSSGLNHRLFKKLFLLPAKRPTNKENH